MKRDSDLIRKLLLILEADVGIRPKIYAFEIGAPQPFIEGYTDEAVYEHLLMLLNSPFITGSKNLSGQLLVQKLTWEGREFLDAIRGDNVWAKTKLTTEKIGGVGLGFMWEVAKGLIKQEITSRFGIDGS